MFPERYGFICGLLLMLVGTSLQQDPIQPLEGSPETYVGGTVTLQVPMAAGVAQGFWYKNGVPVTGMARYSVSISGVMHQLTITGAVSGDAASYIYFNTFVSPAIVKSGFLTVHEPVNGGLSEWNPWNNPSCSVTCGNGTITLTRSRLCNNPAPRYGGQICPDPLTETVSRVCVRGPCPINGGFSEWSQWNVAQCSQTCGSNIMTTATRARACDNPIPQNNGAPCTGDTQEEKQTLCEINPCPGSGICNDVVRSSEVGYRYHPTDCDKYIMCFYNPNGNVLGVYRSCPFGYYWNQVTFRCVASWKVSCPLEKCTGACKANYKMEGSCRSYWKCGQNRTEARCCPKGFSFTADEGCRANFYCEDVCPTPYIAREVCDKRPSWNNPTEYNFFVGNLGWQQATCASRTAFDLLDCGCVETAQDTCVASNEESFTSTAMPSWLNVSNVVVSGGMARFLQNSLMNLDVKVKSTECPVLKLTFRESAAVTGRRVLASSSDCKEGNTLLVVADDAGIQFETVSWYGHVSRMFMSTQGIPRSQLKTVSVLYKDNYLIGVIESDNVKYISQLHAPDVSIMACGLTIGSDGTSSTAFVGDVDMVSIYKCVPGNLI
ncbi:uncharacterized protein [Haliotis cracherodii]|uniref:uncharacterized protein n=1 Tax=Haliotis cracherodii TaxID=6455 RepID=UPI0039EC4753